MPSEAAPDLTVLSFDTSAAHCAAALLCGGRVLSTRTEEMAKGQAERLMPLLELVLAENGKTWADLDAIGVGIGPGNFTGIRIAVAAARGLALSLNIPAIGMSLLEATAYGRSNVIACLPAPRDRVYVQAFVAGGDTAPRLARLSPEDLPRYPVTAKPGVVGPAADAVGALLQLRTVEPLYPMTEAIARHAAVRCLNEAGNGSIARPAPLYLNPADAAPSRHQPPVMLP